MKLSEVRAWSRCVTTMRKKRKKQNVRPERQRGAALTPKKAFQTVTLPQYGSAHTDQLSHDPSVFRCGFKKPTCPPLPRFGLSCNKRALRQTPSPPLSLTCTRGREQDARRTFRRKIGKLPGSRQCDTVHSKSLC